MLLKKFKENEKGSITIFVLSTMLLVAGVIFVSYFSMMNKSASQEEELKKDGIIAVFGCSDDLCEIRGSLYDEIECYYDKKIVYVKESDCFVTVDYYYENPNELIKVDLSKRPYIDISNKNGWKYELPNIPQVEFKIYEEESIYCTGKLFYLKDFINWQEK